MAQVKTDLHNKTVEQKLTLAETVITDSTNNPHLSAPNPPTVVTLSAKRYNLQVALANAANKRQASLTATEGLKTAEKEFDVALAAHGASVQLDTGGVPEKILSTGFDVADESNTPITLGALVDFGVTAGDEPGEFDVDWDNLHGASGYETETTTDLTGATGWGNRKFSTRSKVELQGLTSGTPYLVRSRAVGAAGAGPWTAPVQKRAP